MSYKTQARTANSRTVFTTLDGQEIKFVPFSWDEYLLAKEGLLDEFRQRGKAVDCPQYEVKYATGASAWLDHDATTITQVPPGTADADKARIIAEQQAKYAQYQADSKEFTDADTALMLDFVYEDSLGNLVLPEDSAWEARQIRRRIKIPVDPEEKRRHYINTVMCKRADQSDLIATITAISMGAVKEDDVTAIVDSFRDRVGRGLRAAFGYAFAATETGGAGQLDQRSEVQPVEDSESVGADAGAVQGVTL